MEGVEHMAEDAIDYQSLYEGLQNELEQARLTILKMRQEHTLRPDIVALRNFVQENYVLIVVSVMVLTFIVSSLKTLRELWRDHEAQG